jgi:alkylresorcinol/alkylpyrone synthase
VVNGTPLPRFLDSYQEIAHHSLDAIAIRQSEFWESVTDKTIPELVGQLVPRVVQQLLQRHHLTMGDIAHWAFHTGGRKILEVCQECLSLSDAQMKPSYEVLWQYGNMLSASVVFSLQQMLNERRPQPGELGMLLALGPGMTGGAFLLSW